MWERRLWVISACVCAALRGDDVLPSASKFPVPPVWPGAARLTPQLKSQYVFLSQAGDKIIIRLPPGSAYVKMATIGRPGLPTSQPRLFG